MDHIVYCDKKAKELARLLSGEQTMVIRGAAGRKLPHGRVAIDDTAYLLENDSSGIIRAKGIVSSVFHSDKLSLEESEKIIEENMNRLKLTRSSEEAVDWETLPMSDRTQGHSCNRAILLCAGKEYG
ncbi:MAG: hypothetical protein ACOX7R_03460 [Acetivibrionales bacterium]